MPRELPPLNAVRAFEAAGRNLSISKAARELGVSSGAVSHQVRLLEEYFGLPLFLRETRRVSLTSAGQACLPALTAGLDRIEEAVHRMNQAQKPGRVSVSVEISFAERWLVPRLARFRATYPEVVVELMGRPLDLEAAVYKSNFAIAYGSRRFQGLIVERMMSEHVYPVCSPTFASAYGLERPSDLRRGAPLLHDDTMARNAWYPDWSTWLSGQGQHDVDTAAGNRFTASSMALQAACEGDGIALGRGALVASDLRSGRLIAPFGIAHAPSFDYFVVGLPAALEQPQVAVFRDWLLDEGAKEGAALRPTG